MVLFLFSFVRFLHIDHGVVCMSFDLNRLLWSQVCNWEKNENKKWFALKLSCKHLISAY